MPGFESAKTPPLPVAEDSIIANPLAAEEQRSLFENFTPSSSPPSFEVEMQDSFQDENTS